MIHASEKPCQQITIDTERGSLTVNYYLQRSLKARYLRMQFEAFSKVIRVTLPRHLGAKEAEAFILKNAKWISKKMKGRTEAPSSLLEHLTKDPYLSINGKHCKLSVQYRSTHPQTLWNDETDEATAILNPDACPNRQLTELLYNLAKKHLYCVPMI